MLKRKAHPLIPLNGELNEYFPPWKVPLLRRGGSLLFLMFILRKELRNTIKR